MVLLELFIDIILLALGSTQPLPEMSTRNISWGVNLHVPIVIKSGSLDLLEPSGPVQACNRDCFIFAFTCWQEKLRKWKCKWRMQKLPLVPFLYGIVCKCKIGAISQLMMSQEVFYIVSDAEASLLSVTHPDSQSSHYKHLLWPIILFPILQLQLLSFPAPSPAHLSKQSHIFELNFSSWFPSWQNYSHIMNITMYNFVPEAFTFNRRNLIRFHGCVNFILIQCHIVLQ
jgi:hypothetical protein